MTGSIGTRGGAQRRLGRVYLATYGARLLVVAIGLAASVVAARGLGPAGRGTYAVVLSATALVVQLGNLGLSAAIVYFVSRRARRAGIALGFAYLAGGALLALGGAALLAWPARGALRAFAPLLVLWAPIQLVALLQDQIFLGLRSFGRYNVLQVGSRCLGLAAALAAVWLHPGNARAFVFGQIVAEACNLGTGTALLLLQGSVPSRPSTRLSGPVLRIASRAFPMLLLPFLLVRSDILLLRLFRGAAETGIYAVSAQLVDFLLLLPATVAAVLFPSMADSRNPESDTIRALRGTIVFLVPAAAMLAIGGWTGIRVVYGSAFQPAFWPLLLLLPGALLLGSETVVVQFFARLGYPRFLTAYWAGGLLLNLIVNVAAIPRFGAPAAALSSTLAYGLVALLVFRRFLLATGLTLAELSRRAAPRAEDFGLFRFRP